LSPPPPSSLVAIKPANPDSPGKTAVKTERDFYTAVLHMGRYVKRRLFNVNNFLTSAGLAEVCALLNTILVLNRKYRGGAKGKGGCDITLDGVHAYIGRGRRERKGEREVGMPGRQVEKPDTLELFPSSVREPIIEGLDLYTYVYIYVQFDLKFSTGKVAPKPDSLVQNQTPGNPKGKGEGERSG